MKKLFALLAAFLLTLSAMADVYKIDPSKEIVLEDPNIELDGVVGILTNFEGTKVLSLGGGNEWDITSIDLKDWGSKHADYNYVLFEKTDIFGLYKIRMANADKTFYSPSWSNPANDGCINFQPYPGTGVFVGGNGPNNGWGTDVWGGGLFSISVTWDENFKICGYKLGNQKADENDSEAKYLVPGIGQKSGGVMDVTVKLYSALVIDIPASVEAAYKTVPANVKNDAVEAAYAKAKANPTQANLDALKAAIAAIGKSSLINNAGIDGNTQGWTCNLPQGGGGPMKPSNDAMEFWAGNAEPRNDASFDYYQEITVPNGKYVLQAEMFNSSNGEEGTGHAPNGNAGLYASSGSSEVFVGVTTDSEVLAQYTTDVLTVKDGKIRIGVKPKGYMSARWFVADNFKLWYAGDDTDQTAAAAVVEKINAIGTVEYTEACKALIDAAREAYDALTDDQKALITEAQQKVLTDAEAAYAELKVAAEKAAADQAAADAVVASINAIGTVEYTEACKALIDAAREAYDALTDDQKALITEAQQKVLTDAEAAYAELKVAAEKAAADQTAADTVVEKINAIGTVEYTEACKALIDEARAAYDALTDDQKALVTAEQLKVLTDAEAAYAELKVAAEKAAADQAAADAVVASINAIGTVEYTEACKTLIDAAREAYDALTDDQKALITAEQLKVLTDAEAEYQRLKDITTGIAGVNATSAQKDGKYIKNRKVVIVKNGKEYNAQGQNM